MNAPHDEASEFAKISKRENRVYVGNLSYDVRYRDLMEFMRGGGCGGISPISCCFCVIGHFERVFVMSGCGLWGGGGMGLRVLR